MLTIAQVEDLLRVYGADFLGFVINEDVERVRLRVSGELTAFSNERENVLGQLFVIESRLTRFNDFEQALQRAAVLTEYNLSLNSTLTSTFRDVSGGNSVLPVVSDAVEQLLLHFAETTYPIYLQHEHNPAPIKPTVISWQDPAREELYAAVMTDTVLSRLYPTETEGSGPRGMAFQSMGRGGSIQLWMFAESITSSAWHYMHLEEDEPTLEAYAEAVLRIVRLLKGAIQGRNVLVPMRIGLAGVLLPDEIDTIDLGWARVRRVAPRDGRLIGQAPVEGQLGHTNASGESIQIDYAGNLVLELDVPYKLSLGELDFHAPWPKGLGRQDLVSGVVECLRLALLLADVGQNATAVSTWQSVVDPLFSSELIGWSDPRWGVNLTPVRLTDEKVDLWKEWAQKIHVHRTPQTSVSVRRILRAVSERKEPEDTLIDAVVVWENIFGAAQETTLRVTMSVAWFLGADANGRQALHKELKSIYQQRSDIVHGNAGLKTDKTHPYAMRAIEISIEILRVLFSDHPEFLKLKSGAERSALVLLDARGEVSS